MLKREHRDFCVTEDLASTIYPLRGACGRNLPAHGSLKMYATGRRRAMPTDWRFFAFVHTFVPTS